MTVSLTMVRSMLTLSSLRGGRMFLRPNTRCVFAQQLFRAAIATRSHGGRPVAVAHAGETGAAQQSVGAAAAQGGGVYERWRSQWSSFLSELYSKGHFVADQATVRPDKLDAHPGAVKRAVLSFARQRQDLRLTLPEAPLRALVEAGFPVSDRKSVNAYKRLEASILRGRDLPAGDGGPADFQDIIRMLYALSVVDPATAELESPGLTVAACNLMPAIIKASQEEKSSPQEPPASTVGMPRPVFHSQQRRAQRQRLQPEGSAQGGGGGGRQRQQRNAGPGQQGTGRQRAEGQRQQQRGPSWWDSSEQP